MRARPISAPPAPETPTATAMRARPIGAPPAPETPTATAMQSDLRSTAMPTTPRSNGGRPVKEREKDNDLCVHVHKAQYATY